MAQRPERTTARSQCDGSSAGADGRICGKRSFTAGGRAGLSQDRDGAAGADQRTAGKRFAAGVSSGGRGSEIGRQHPGQDCAETGGRQKWLWSAGDERSGAFRDPDEQFRGCGADACSAATKIPRNTRGSISGQAKGKQRLQGYPS